MYGWPQCGRPCVHQHRLPARVLVWLSLCSPELPVSFLTRWLCSICAVQARAMSNTWLPCPPKEVSVAKELEFPPPLYCLMWNWSFHFKNSITCNENSHRWPVLPYWTVSSHRLTFSMAESSPSTDVIFSFPLFESHCLKLIWATPLTGGRDPGQEFRGLSIPYMGPTDLISSLVFALLLKSQLIR